ncbi:MAG: beta-propeller domain-containing protein, partial [Planctomycetales bacterium]|nr:beta-propeller domain-containing protein [Planctomycetales bacterium]
MSATQSKRTGSRRFVRSLVRKPSLRRKPRLNVQVESLEDRRLLAVDAILVSDAYSVRQNADPIELSVLANDVFPAGYLGAGEISAVSYGSQGGQIELADDAKSLIYRPPADYAGQEDFNYFVDGQYAASVRVNIESAVRDDRLTIRPDGEPHVLNVLSNDPFWSDYTGARQITAVSVSSGDATVDISADGKSIVFQAGSSFSTSEQFVYVVDGTYSARVDVTIPRSLTDDRYEIIQNSPTQTLNVLANDSFWNGYSGAKVITHVENVYSGDAAGAATIAADGKSILYTPATDTAGSQQLVYVVDGQQEAHVTIYLMQPVRGDYGEVDMNSTAHAFNVIDNDRYWSVLQNRELDIVQRVTAVEPTTEQGGTATVSADGRSVMYTPPQDFIGEDRVTYTADGLYHAVLQINVSRPVRDDYLSVYQDTPNQRLSVLSNDFLGNGYPGAKQITSVSDTSAGGTVVMQDGALLYTPAEGITSDSFTYTVDGQLDASVSIYVTPLAQSDYYQFCPTANATHQLNVLANDNFKKGYLGAGVITAAEVTRGNGQVSVSATGTALVYQPSSSGNDLITYTVDGKYQTNASIYIYSLLYADQYTVNQNSAATSLNVLANDFRNLDHFSCSSYSGPRRITAVSESVNGGTVSIAADGVTVNYVPAEDYYGTDSFTYVVDGVMESTVTLNVIRRVRDDEYRVAAGASKSLNVLTNDLFGADYGGAQQITQVTASQVGATVNISADGKTLEYSAPAGFTGEDTLTYTVDGQLKASVTIQPTIAQPYPQFSTAEEYIAFLQADALQRYEHLFGQTHYDRIYFDGVYDASNGAPVAESANVRGHSETNVQVAGVDEADIVEFDSDYLYTLTGNDVVILSAWPAEDLAEVGRYHVAGDAIAMFLHGDRLTVISQIVTWGDQYPIPWAADALSFDAIMPWPYFGSPEYTTIVTVLDVSDRATPSQVQRTEIEGQYVSSRGIGDYVYVSLTHSAVSSGPEVIYSSPDAEMGVYETREEFLARIAQSPGDFIADALPNYTSYGADDNVARTGLLQEPEDVYKPLSEGAMQLVSLVSFNVVGNEPGLSDTAAIYTNGATEVYASLEHFYIFENGWNAEDGNVTRILQFNWDAETGAAQFAAKGLVPGYMLNQFSADEYNGDLRIATTVSRSYVGVFSQTTENDLFVLREDGGVLDFVGSLQNFGVGETLRSVRFMGPRAFVVTYRTVDPLFAIDLTEATKPTIAGYLTIPGFSTYAQMIDDSHL